MRPNGGPAQIAAVVLCVLLAFGTAWLWGRLRRWWGVTLRVLAVTLCATSALSAALVAVNRQLNLYTSWSELFGTRVTAPVAGHTQTVIETPSGSRVVTFSVRGKSSGISLAAYAYLPPGYDSAAGQRTRYPVIEAVDGFPGSPNTWLVSLGAAANIDQEIRNGRMAPTVVIFPFQVLDPTRDSECVNAVGGDQFDTFLTTDLRTAVTEQFRVRTDRVGWGIVGTSTGGFCAFNLALRHPEMFAAAASLSGYFTAITDRTTGDLYRGNQRLRQENSPLWRITNLPVPSISLYLASARDDKAGIQQLQQFMAAVKPPLRVTTVIVEKGGHTGRVWAELEPSMWDWFANNLAAPQYGAVTGPGPGEPSHGPVVTQLEPYCVPAGAGTTQLPPNRRKQQAGSPSPCPSTRR
jgi:enterochelin esterase-like enzyme